MKQLLLTSLLKKHFMHRVYLFIASLFGALAVVLGAFGTHGLKRIVPPETLSTFQTGVQYQMYHALALIAVAIIYERVPIKWLKWSGIFFIAGTFLFSGSLYLLTFSKSTETISLKGIGFITPFGGLCFIAGWIFFLIGVSTKS